MELTDTASVRHVLKKVVNQVCGENVRLKSRLTFGGLVTVKEQDFEVDVVQREAILP